MKIINEQLLDETQAKALQSPRLRMNYNFHERLDDPINRLLNAMEPGTYLRPHRHLNPIRLLLLWAADRNKDTILLDGVFAC